MSQSALCTPRGHLSWSLDNSHHIHKSKWLPDLEHPSYGWFHVSKLRRRALQILMILTHWLFWKSSIWVQMLAISMNPVYSWDGKPELQGEAAVGPCQQRLRKWILGDAWLSPSGRCKRHIWPSNPVVRTHLAAIIAGEKTSSVPVQIIKPLGTNVVLQELKPPSGSSVATLSRLSHQQNTLHLNYLSFDLVVSKAKVLEVGSRIRLDWWKLMLQHLDHLWQLGIPPAELPTEQIHKQNSLWHFHVS